MLLILCFSTYFLVGLCYGTTTETTVQTTARPSYDCYSHTCYERGCLSADITNSSDSGLHWIFPCMTNGTGYCAIHITSSGTSYVVRATCEQNCQNSGYRDSPMATFCCQSPLCNSDENDIPVASASPLAWKWSAFILLQTILYILSQFC